MSSNKSTPRKKKLENKKENRPGNEVVEPKYGPLPRFRDQKVWSKGIIIVGVAIYMWYYAKNVSVVSLAKQKEVLVIRGQNFDCDLEYLHEIQQFPSCIPKKCGRFVSDKLVTISEVETLLNVAKKAISLGESTGSAAILDLHTGALSHKDKFVNINALPEIEKIITATDLAIYRLVKDKIQKAIAENFGIDSGSLYLTYPTFFSRLSNLEPKTPHDEYWHVHVDKETYESFHYTSLLYFTDFDLDFKGGRLLFVNNVEKSTKNTTVEPRKGRVLMFTSGKENPHFVERVTDGTRYAITVSFTCDQSKAISDPVIKQH